jgi:antitoxin MazE
MKLHIGKWGNSLAVRLPREIVERFGLKEGGAIDGDVLAQVLQQTRAARETALLRIRKLQRPLPADYKFDREEANVR